MKNIIHPSKQKLVVVLVAGAASFGGLLAASQALGVHQVSQFLQISLYLYGFLVVWQTFVFDLHLKKTFNWRSLERSFFRKLAERFAYLREGHHFLHFQNYLILPGIIYWTTVTILYLNPFDSAFKLVWIWLAAIALGISFWYLKTIFYAHHEAGRIHRQFIFLTKFYASFLSFAAALGISRYFGYGGAWFGLLIFLLTFLLMYQALFQHHHVDFSMLKFLFGICLILGCGAYLIYYLWNVNYYSGALVLSAVYNTIWGIIHHKYLDEDLIRERVYEYLAVLFVILVIIFSTTNFAERI